MQLARLEQTSTDSQTSPTDEQCSSSQTSTQVDGLQSSPDQLDSIIKDEQQPKTFEQSGIFITEDDIIVDIANTTGLRKTGYSANLYADDGVPLKPLTESKIPRSPAPIRRKSIDNILTESKDTALMSRKTPVYRSVRKPATNGTTIGIGKKDTPTKDVNTWSGRTAKKRPTIGTDTFNSQQGVAQLNGNNGGSFTRNSSIRGSQTLYDKNGRRIKSTTTSANTSPTKQTPVATSPLAQQILEAAGAAKNDSQMLEKMKTLLSKYTKSKSTDEQTNNKEYDDFTTAWVNSNGTLDRVTNCSTSPIKMQSKRSSAASSIDSMHSKDLAMAAALSPRRDRGISRIPAPIRQNTELY